ncbi:MAG: hypothetical protein JWL95_3072, partial [Gemmatimonadetes bacterium]|nr:hypothetical protein [Gemmatimonadota bacterium]
MQALFLLFTMSAYAAPATILEAVRNPGFVPNPAQTTFTLTDDGALTLTVMSFRDKST